MHSSARSRMSFLRVIREHRKSGIAAHGVYTPMRSGTAREILPGPEKLHLARVGRRPRAPPLKMDPGNDEFAPTPIQPIESRHSHQTLSIRLQVKSNRFKQSQQRDVRLWISSCPCIYIVNTL